MIRSILFLFLVINLHGFAQQKDEIDSVITQWHKAAAEADFGVYFDLMTSDAIFIGTDPTENWSYEDFKVFSKPYFDQGKAWSFTSLDRNIFYNEGTNLAWFDELLETQMGICRGSGILQKTPHGWKIKHYVLSIAIPNDKVKEITEVKKTFDAKLIQKLRTVKN